MSGGSKDAVLVDVGIPTFGSPPYLAEAVECVLSQTLTSWRLTISENGPGSDEVAGIVRPYLEDPRVSHVRTGSNLGPARNSTRLIQTGSAPYVAILHDDDRWDPGFLARRVDFLESHRSCGFVFSSTDYIDEDRVVFRREAGLPAGVHERRRFLVKLYRRHLIDVCSVVVRRAAYEAVGPRFNERIVFWDYDMWLRLAARFDVGVLDVCDNGYRLHGSQTTTQTTFAHWGEHMLRALDEADRFLPSDFPAVERRRARCKAHLRAAVDARRRGDRHAWLRSLEAAARAHPAAPLDPLMLWTGIGWLKWRARRRAVVDRQHLRESLRSEAA